MQLPLQWIAAEVSNLKIFAHFYGVRDSRELWNNDIKQCQITLHMYLKSSNQLSSLMPSILVL